MLFVMSQNREMQVGSGRGLNVLNRIFANEGNGVKRFVALPYFFEKFSFLQ